MNTPVSTGNYEIINKNLTFIVLVSYVLDSNWKLLACLLVYQSPLFLLNMYN